MSGRSKKIAYYVCDCLLAVLVIAGTFFLLFTAPEFGTAEYIAIAFLIISVLLRVPEAIHEAGHLLFGALSGLKFHAVTCMLFRFERGKRPHFVGYRDPAAGASEMFPVRGGGVRKKMIAFTLGGSAVNLILGGILLTLYFSLQYSATMLFFAIFSFFLFYEGIRALIPVELSAGKTDGKLLIGFIKRERDEEVTLRVLTAQGILYQNEFSAVQPAILFEVPVVREDLPAFSALLLIRVQYFLYKEEDELAYKQLERLQSFELSGEMSEEVQHYLSYFTGEFVARKRQELF